MTTLLDEHVPRTLDTLLSRLEHDAPAGSRVEAWLFEGASARREAERGLRGRGIEAVVRSAYKPLMHFFLEEIDTVGLRRATVHYPVRDDANEKRFRLEAYPLSPLLPGVDLRFAPGSAETEYRVELERRDGGMESRSVFVPNRIREDHLGERVLAPTGWLRVTGPEDARPRIDEPVVTEYEAIFERAMNAVRAHDWGTREPYFEQLVIRAEVPDAEQRLAFGEECLSTCEALHEELYFSILEFFKHRAGRPIDDRTTRPGQIVPDIRQGAASPRVRVTLETPAADEGAARAAAGAAALSRLPSRPFRRTSAAFAAPAVSLDAAAAPLAITEVWAATAALEGRPFSARSRQGRPVPWVYRPGRRPAVVVTGGQHANETTGVVAALRAARRLAADPGASFAVIPLENPDGYALHRRLCGANPRHMHHAARYTALGDDLGSRSSEPWYEKEARLEAQRLSRAALHINLHGYPSHEWTRPLTGYLPRGFQTWSVPKGFYLILRHHGGWRSRAGEFLEAVTSRLAAVPGLADLNRAQIAAAEAHAGERPDPILHWIPCQVTEDDAAPFPLALITEFPDETIYGDLFVLGHTVLMETVLAAEAAYSRMAQG